MGSERIPTESRVEQIENNIKKENQRFIVPPGDVTSAVGAVGAAGAVGHIHGMTCEETMTRGRHGHTHTPRTSLVF